MIHSLFARAVSSASRRRLSSAAAAAATRATSAARDRSASLAASRRPVSAPPPPSSIPRRRSSARLTTVMSATEVTSAAVRTSPWYRRGSRSVGRWKQSQSRDASSDTASAFGASETTAASASRTSPGANPCAMSSSYARASFWRDRSDAATAGRRGSSGRRGRRRHRRTTTARRGDGLERASNLASARALISTLGAVVWAPVPLPAAPPPRPWRPATGEAAVQLGRLLPLRLWHGVPRSARAEPPRRVAPKVSTPIPARDAYDIPRSCPEL